MSKSVTKNNVSNDFSKPVTAQILPPREVYLKEHEFSCSRNLVEIVLFIVDSECSKHMTRNLKLLINFVEKFLDQRETSSRHVDLSNMHTFYQRYPSEHRWTKDHPLEQVIGNPSQSVRTRRQLESDAEMCMFTLTMSRTEPKNIKEAMADSAWIASMQEELHQFDRLDVWELVDRPLCTNVINLKWL
nr:Gag-Pol polyprotein [Tanacetum cinerariifolium]